MMEVEVEVMEKEVLGVVEEGVEVEAKVKVEMEELLGEAVEEEEGMEEVEEITAEVEVVEVLQVLVHCPLTQC